MKIYFTSTINPAMLSKGAESMTVRELDEEMFTSTLLSVKDELIPAIGHKNTAELLERVFHMENLFQRRNISLANGDTVLAAIPQFRVGEAREYTDEEIKKARFRFFEATADFQKVVDALISKTR